MDGMLNEKLCAGPQTTATHLPIRFDSELMDLVGPNGRQSYGARIRAKLNQVLQLNLGQITHTPIFKT
jgi:hypothetical protein